MPVQLANLYCTAQDVYELVGIDAAQLRLDDQNQASGQQVQATADAAIGATTISVSALQYPMLRGSRLVFSDASMASPVEVTLDAVAAVNATTLTVVALATQVNSGAIAIDNGVNVWLAGLLAKSIKYATSRIQDYCLLRYDDNVLTGSWTVNGWATTLAARWLATRLYRAAPDQIEKAYQEALEDLKAVQKGELNLANVGPRTSEWPFISNVTIDLGYTYRKIRVEPTISEPTPTQYPQATDWNSYFTLEW
jgi:Protein of unknown function (DUF1320)